MHIRLALPAILVAVLLGFPSDAGEREEYLVCVTTEVGNGVGLAEIGAICLKEVRPEAKKEESEEYPYERTLRGAFADEGSLRDPEAARFQEVVYSRNYNAWCGKINAPNGFGGFAGWEYFALRDRYRGSGRRQDFIDLRMGVKEYVEGTCKKYQAWRRELW